MLIFLEQIIQSLLDFSDENRFLVFIENGCFRLHEKASMAGCARDILLRIVGFDDMVLNGITPVAIYETLCRFILCFSGV